MILIQPSEIAWPHIRDNYPENYNDWVESAEFVSPMIVRFGHKLLPCRLNAPNNFLSTAERPTAYTN